MQDQKFKLDFLDPKNQLYENYQSVLGEDGDVYLFLGYDYKKITSPQEENKFKRVFKLEFSDGGITPYRVPVDEKTLLFRSHYSLVATSSFIYIIGGFNYKEGCLN
jgi:hypothetical protein